MVGAEKVVMEQKPEKKVPLARTPVEDPVLWRPSWTDGSERNPNLLWLDKNENLDPELSAVCSKVLAEIPPRIYSTYPESQNLYRKLARSLKLEANQLLLTAGSDGAIRAVFEAFISPGDKVIHTQPTFAMYSVYSQMYGAAVTKLDYHPSSVGPTLDAEQIITSIKKVQPRLVCLPNPDSPSGTAFDPDTLQRIIVEAGNAGAVILIDEAYFPFYEHTCIETINKHPHLAVCRTFAKAWGLAGLRIGYVAAQNELVTKLHKVRPMYEVNTLSVAAIERMLDFESEMLASVRRLKEGQDYFASELQAMGFRAIKTNGNFMHVDFGSHSSQVQVALSGICLYRNNFKDPCIKDFSRFSLTTKTQFQPVVNAIRMVVKG